MSKHNQSNSADSLSSVGDRILRALTQEEISELIDALFAVLPDNLRSSALAELEPNTQKTVQEILTPSPLAQQNNLAKSPPVSQAKLAQTWSKLWLEWDEIIEEASLEEGEYIAQEEDWEQPYFDAYSLSENLDKVAQKMQPLLMVAFENRFNPDTGFVSTLLEAESKIRSGIPDWMDIDDGIHLEQYVTESLLQWEWLTVKDARQDPFDFAQRIKQLSEQFECVSLDDHTTLDFLTQLSDEEQQCILAGLNANRETGFWKQLLDNTYSYWHKFYITAIHQYAPPEVYLDNLRATIPQQWQNGLPVIEDLLAKQDYSASLTVIEATLDALLKSKHQDQSWSPETLLLFTIVDGFSSSDGYRENETTLLRFYQQTAQGLGQSQRVNALEIQLIVFESCFDWARMFQTFAEIHVCETTDQSLFQSWRNYIIRRAKPGSHWDMYQKVKSVDIWWLHWLIDSIATPNQGPTWFAQQILQWLTSLPGEQRDLGEAYDILRLLTKDLTEIHCLGQPPYPQFYQVVIRPRDLSAPDDTSRRAYLQQYAPNQLWDQVMAYWKAQLHQFVPRPELSRNSDYTAHAQWMSALQELAPQSYEILLAQWRVEHQRRRNLWKALLKN